MRERDWKIIVNLIKENTKVLEENHYESYFSPEMLIAREKVGQRKVKMVQKYLGNDGQFMDKPLNVMSIGAGEGMVDELIMKGCGLSINCPLFPRYFWTI